MKKILAGILALATLAGGVLTATGCKNEKDKNSGENSAVEDVFTDNSGMEVEDDKNSAIRMMSTRIHPKQYAEHGISPQVETAYTIEATITPAQMASVTVLEWTIEFERTDGPWSKGKNVNDYVKVTPIGELGHQATVECLQAFGEAIIVKASVKDNPEMYGSCKCDYTMRYESVEAELADGTCIIFERGKVSTFTFEATNAGEGYVLFTGSTEGVGTKDGTSFELSMSIDETLSAQLEANGFTVYGTQVVYGYKYGPQLQLGVYGIETMLYLPGADEEIVGEEYSNLIKQGYLWATTGTNDDGVLSNEERDAYNRYRKALITAWREVDEFLFTLTLTQRREGGDILETYDAEMDMAVEDLFPELAVGGVTLNVGNLEF